MQMRVVDQYVQSGLRHEAGHVSPKQGDALKLSVWSLTLKVQSGKAPWAYGEVFDLLRQQVTISVRDVLMASLGVLDRGYQQR